jgi:hypothetical protein
LSRYHFADVTASFTKTAAEPTVLIMAADSAGR